MPAGPGRATSLGRLTKRSEFLGVAASGRKWVTPGLILQCRPRRPAPLPEEDPSRAVRQPTERTRQGNRDVPAAESIRVGYTASRKVGSAVERNRARRRLRAAVAAVLATEGTPGTDYVVIARRSTPSRPFADLIDDLTSALRRLRQREGQLGDQRRKQR